MTNLKNVPKYLSANIFLSSLLPLLNRLALSISGSPATAATPPDSVNALTFLHEFINGLELDKAATMVSTSACQLARLYPESTSVLISLQNRKKTMVLAGAKPSPLIKKSIQELETKFNASEIPLQLIDATDDKARPCQEPPESLTVTAATKLRVKSGQLILYSTSRPTAKERRLIIYCLQHLDKRLSDTQNLQALEKANRLDSLTGLNNRRYFDEIIKKENERADRYHHPTSLIMFDLDHFKKVNDNFGHQTGDQVLKTIGNILRAEVRQSDTPCRYGGEEFAVILPETGLCEAQRIAVRIRQAIEQQNIVAHNNIHLRITASLGIACTEDNRSIDLIMAADQALYRAKESGRNQIATAPPSCKPAIKPSISHCFPVKAVLDGGR